MLLGGGSESSSFPATGEASFDEKNDVGRAEKYLEIEDMRVILMQAELANLQSDLVQENSAGFLPAGPGVRDEFCCWAPPSREPT